MPEPVILSEVIAAPGPIEIGGAGSPGAGAWYMYPPDTQQCNVKSVSTCATTLGQVWGSTPYGEYLAYQTCISHLCAPRPVRGGTLVQTRSNAQ